MKAVRIQVTAAAIILGLGIVPQARAYFAGGGKDAAKGNDCLIGYNVDPTTVTQDGKKYVVECTDCDPSCDLDGANTANGSCTFQVGVCINQSGVEGCTPPAALDKAKAKVKGAKVAIDVSQLLQGSVCGALVDLPVALKKNGKKSGKAKFSLKAQVKKNKSAGIDKARKDNDKLTYVCNPRPAGEACPSVSTTTTTVTTTTTSTMPDLCGNAMIDGDEECDDGNANDGDGCTKTCRFCGSNGGGGSVSPPLECQVPLTCKTGPNNGLPCSTDDDCSGGFCTTSNIVGCDANCTLPACSNNNVSGSETCDDGNIDNFDSCPSDCIIDTCTNPASSPDLTVSVNFAGSENVAGITVFVEYPEGMAIIPGSGSDATAYVSNLPGSAGASANDYDHAVQVAVADFEAFPSGLLFNLAFETCDGATPTSGDFACTVISAGDVNLQPVSGVTCSVSIP